MAKRDAPETLADLLGPHLLKADLGVTAWAESKGINPRTLYRAVRGEGRRDPYLPTMAAIAKALGVSVERVRAAIEASRAAAGK